MKPFNLEEYLTNPSKKLVTREGRDARIICTDRKVDSYTNCTIVALVEDEDGTEDCSYFTKNGKYMDGFESSYDLFFAPEKKEGWINIYKNYRTSNIYNSKEDAFNNRAPNYIATMKIEWEE